MIWLAVLGWAVSAYMFLMWRRARDWAGFCEESWQITHEALEAAVHDLGEYWPNVGRRLGAVENNRGIDRLEQYANRERKL